MKEHWERKTPYVKLSVDQLDALIQPAFPGRRVRLHEIMTGGLANTLYKVQLHNVTQPLVVRLYTRDPLACRKEIELYQRVHERVPLPELFYADLDATLHEIAYTITAYIAAPTLREVLKGGDRADQASAMYAAGATLAAIGSYTFDRPGFFGPGLKIVQPLDWGADALAWYIDHCLDNGGAAVLGPELAAQMRRFVQNYAPLLDALPTVNALVHADYNEPNILVQQHGDRWEVAAVLDWEFACSGPPLYDIGNMLRNENRWGPEFARNFVQGFAENGGTLPTNWRAIARLLDLISLGDFLTRATPGDAMARDICTLIAQTIDRVDQLPAA